MEKVTLLTIQLEMILFMDSTISDIYTILLEGSRKTLYCQNWNELPSNYYATDRKGCQGLFFLANTVPESAFLG